MSYCPICGQNHESTGCPTVRPVYDEATDAIKELKAELEFVKAENKFLKQKIASLAWAIGGFTDEGEKE
jgi:hypothetical protein